LEIKDMKLTYSWLKDFLETDATPAEIATTLTAIGLEIESLRSLGAGLESFTVAEILATSPHPDAEKLQICHVLTHSGERQIVCGAPNARAGIKVILADIGDIIPTNGMQIKAAKIRGVESNGMLCSARELGIGTEDNGIMELPAATPVAAKAVDVLGLNDTLFDVSITPNRGDCLGVYGVARDLAAAGMGTLKSPSFSTLSSLAEAAVALTLTTSDCPHFVAYRLDGVTNGESPEWLKARLTSVGLRPISALVDITNYFTLTYGRPLHVYDAVKLRGGITVRASAQGESFAALNDKTYTLPSGLCVIADGASVLGIGGVMGGSASGCNATTTSVILESAWFDPLAIARAGRATMIDSDARYRFERGIDPAGTVPYAAAAAQMILELCGGQVTGRSEAGAAVTLSRTIAFSKNAVSLRTGMEVTEEKQRHILTALGCVIDAAWNVLTPNWRPDIEGAADLTEEIARIVGYDILPSTPLPLPETFALAQSSLADKARERLLARGLDEVVHFAFTSEVNAKAFQTDAPLIQVANPISSELSVMRPHLLADILPAVKRNHDRGMRNLALTEIGAVFFGLDPNLQPMRVSGIRTGESALHWQTKPQAVTLYDVKADLYTLLEALDISPASLMLSSDVPAWYHPNKAGRISLGPKVTLGYFGELHPAILRSFGIDIPVMAFECWLDAIPTKQKPKRPEAFRLNEYQASRRDFAFVVDTKTPAGAVRDAIAKSDKSLIQDVTLFDVYEGEHIQTGKKSLAFAVTLQARDRTLTEEELTATSQAIIAAAAGKGAVLR
jgi:phenylalanyl-tRNA synthetase beta chain